MYGIGEARANGLNKISNYQSSRRGRGKSTSYLYIKLTWQKLVFVYGIYSKLE